MDDFLPNGCTPIDLTDLDFFGNGDELCLYWPIGRENMPPLVAFFMHDGGELEPLVSSRSLCNPTTDVLDESKLAALLEFLLEDHAKGMLELDPFAPAQNVEVGAQLAAGGKLDEAREVFERCLATLPEYGFAHRRLALLAQRTGDIQACSRHLCQAILSPLCFGPWWEARRDCVERLRRIGSESVSHELAFLPELLMPLTGDLESDLPHWDKVVEALFARGENRLAASAQISLLQQARYSPKGDRLRIGLGVEQSRQRLRITLERAGLNSRLR